MKTQKIDITKLSATEIAQMFSDYVERMQDQERHTKAACKEVDAFDTCCSSEFPRNVRLQNLLYEKMMNCAVEFEEGGFIAGFQTAVSLISGQEEHLVQPTQITTPNAGKSQHGATLSSQGRSNKLQIDKEMKKKAVKMNAGSDKKLPTYIDTVQISEMFDRTNFKTVRAINQSILPYLNEKDKAEFQADTLKVRRKREMQIYRLSLRACNIYLDYARNYVKFSNFEEGIKKLEKEMKNTFCAACVA